MIKIAIAGIGGRMGQSIYACLQESDANMTLSVATTLANDPAIGKTVGEVFGGNSDVVISDTLNENFDVLIDFTAVQSTLNHIQQCRDFGKAIVIGTTGFSEAELQQIKAAADNQPIFLCLPI